MSLENFLPLRREVRDHWIYSDSDYLKIWIDMLFTARFSPEPKKDIFDGSLYTLNQGEFLFSRSTWGLRLNVKEHKLRKLVTLLINDNMIVKSGRVGRSGATVYSIVNYKKYNNKADETPALPVANSGVEGDSSQPNANVPPTKCQRSANVPPLKNKEKSVNKEIIKDIVSHLNTACTTKYKPTTNKTVTSITARINEGYTLEDFKRVIDVKAKEWIDTEQSKYLRPETLFGTKFESYLNQKEDPKHKPHQNIIGAAPCDSKLTRRPNALGG